RQHYDYGLNPTPRDSGSFQSEYWRPMIEAAEREGKVHWVEGETGELLSDGEDKLWFRCSHGHTPYLLHPYDEKFIYMADLVPTSHHIPLPWVMGYDIAPGRTTQDKKAFYEFILEKDLTLIFEHDVRFWGGKVGRKGSSDFQAAELFEVKENDHQKFELSFD